MHKEVIAIGGSAGSFKIMMDVLSVISKKPEATILICLHRLKTVRKGFSEALNTHAKRKVIEPFDKQIIEAGNVYLASANYHLCINTDGRSFLSTEQTVLHSRPSIDMLFFTASIVYKEKLTGILLSGANRDGADGAQFIEQNGGKMIIQSPNDAQVDTMPLAAIDQTKNPVVMNSPDIIQFLKGK